MSARGSVGLAWTKSAMLAPKPTKRMPLTIHGIRESLVFASLGMTRSMTASVWRGRWSVQRKHKQIAGILQIVVFHGMQVPAAGLHREILLGSDRVRHGRAFQCRAQVEPPQFLERLVVIRHHPTILEGGEHHSACG